MAHTNCEKCGSRIGSWSFKKSVYVWEDTSGKEHNFCSEECLNEWVEDQPTTKEEPTPLFKNQSRDLKLLYYRKKAEVDDLVTALGCADDNTREDLVKMVRESKNELKAIAKALGISPEE